MRIISRLAIEDFVQQHSDSKIPLQIWHDLIKSRSYKNFIELKDVFGNKVDVVNKGYVFDIGSNKYRLAASIHFNKNRLFIREIMTHAEYSKEAWKNKHQDFH